MPYKFFVIPLRDDGSAEQELNAFLASHRVLEVDRRWVDEGLSSYWVMCVDYLGNGASASRGVRREAKGKIDYKEQLSPLDFTAYLQLRTLRKELAQRDSVPVYTIFTNQQLAEVASQRPASKEALGKIAGIGEARVVKYGQAVLDVLAQAVTGADDATSQRPV